MARSYYVAISVVLHAATASAEPQEPPAGELRFGLGAAYLAGRWTNIPAPSEISENEQWARGPAVAFEGAVGTFVGPTTTLGALVGHARTFGVGMELGGSGVSEGDPYQKYFAEPNEYDIGITTIGAYLDHHLGSNEGSFVDFNLGLALPFLSPSDYQDLGGPAVYLGAGFGYDWSLGAGTKLGVLGRFGLATSWGWPAADMIAPALVVTITKNLYRRVGKRPSD